MNHYSVIIGWLYPELMSTYGDRGNIMVLQYRLQQRGIDCHILRIDFATKEKDIAGCDLIFGGGAQDRQQGMVTPDLLKHKKTILKKLFDGGIPGLFVCGAPQLLGHYYTTGDGEKLEGLGIFDMVSRHFGKQKPRCIGNLIGEVDERFKIQDVGFKKTLVGFENHGGRTYLGEGVTPFAKVLKGFGNNGEDGNEGAIYNKCIATYSHGPFLPKNPHIADWLLGKALEVKYKKKVTLEPLDDTLEWKAHEAILQKYAA
jgi:CobQ-like glutamine amidotransferase family enzyme